MSVQKNKVLKIEGVDPNGIISNVATLTNGLSPIEQITTFTDALSAVQLVEKKNVVGVKSANGYSAIIEKVDSVIDQDKVGGTTYEMSFKEYFELLEFAFNNIESPTNSTAAAEVIAMTVGTIVKPGVLANVSKFETFQLTPKLDTALLGYSKSLAVNSPNKIEFDFGVALAGIEFKLELITPTVDPVTGVEGVGPGASAVAIVDSFGILSFNITPPAFTVAKLKVTGTVFSTKSYATVLDFPHVLESMTYSVVVGK